MRAKYTRALLLIAGTALTFSCTFVASLTDHVASTADASLSDGPLDANREAAFCVGAELASDPKNCGACAHVCGGSQLCAQSLCTPTVIASTETLGPALAANAKYVYWSAAGTGGIRRCASGKTCGQAAELFVGPRTQPVTYIVQGESNVYWREGTGALYVCPNDVPGQPCKPRLIATGVPATATFVELGQQFYWQQVEADGGSILRSPVDIYDAAVRYARVARPTSAGVYVTGFAIVDQGAFWAHENFLWACTPAGGPCTGSSGVQVAPLGPSVESLSVGSDGLFWSDTAEGGGVVRSLRSIEAGVSTVGALDAGALAGPTVASEGNVYFSSSDGALTRCPQSGCTAESMLILARDPNIRPVIAVDASYVYWLSAPATPGMAGAVLRVAK